jgi:integrase
MKTLHASRGVSKAMERSRAKLGIKDITMHDLRRTAGTYMSQFCVPKDVRERILNHGGSRKGSITESVYNCYEYDAEKRAALELWAEALDGISELQKEDPPGQTRAQTGTKTDRLVVGLGSHNRNK